MAIEPVRVYEISTGSTTDLNNNEICNETSNDADLGFSMWGGKDNSGAVTKWLAKDKNARVNALTVLTFTTDGFLKNNTSGVITGGNQISIDDISDKYWSRNNSLGYVYPRTLSDKVGIKISVPTADLHVNGTFRVLTQAGGNINEISNDGTFTTSTDTKLSTSLAIKTYVDAQVSTGGSKWTRVDSTLGYYTLFPNTTTDRVAIGSNIEDDDYGILQINQQSSDSNQGISIYDWSTSQLSQMYINSSSEYVIRVNYTTDALKINTSGGITLRDGVSYISYITEAADMAPINTSTIATTYAINAYMQENLKWDSSGNYIFPKNRDLVTVSVGKDIYSNYQFNIHSDTGACLRLSGNTTSPREGGTIGFGGSPSYNYIKELTEDNIVIGAYTSISLYSTLGGYTALKTDNTGHILLRYGTNVDEIGESTTFNWSFAADDQLLTALAIKNYVDGQAGSSPWLRNTGTGYLYPATITDKISIGATTYTDYALNIYNVSGNCIRLYASDVGNNYRNASIIFGSSGSTKISEFPSDQFNFTCTGAMVFQTGASAYSSLTLLNTGYIQLSAGTSVNNISTSGTFTSADDNRLATMLAIKTYVDSQSGTTYWTRNTSGTNYIIPATRADKVVLDNNTTQLNVLSHVLNISSIDGNCVRLCGASEAAGGRIDFGDLYYCYIEEPQGADDTLRIKAPKIFLSRSTGSGIANYTNSVVISSDGIALGDGVTPSNNSSSKVYIYGNTSSNLMGLKLHNYNASGGVFIDFYGGDGAGGAGAHRVSMGYQISSDVDYAGISVSGSGFSIYSEGINNYMMRCSGSSTAMGGQTDPIGYFDLNMLSYPLAIEDSYLGSISATSNSAYLKIYLDGDTVYPYYIKLWQAA